MLISSVSSPCPSEHSGRALRPDVVNARPGRRLRLIGIKVSLALALYGCGGASPGSPTDTAAVNVDPFEGSQFVVEPNTAATGRAAESKAADLASGKADVVDLVTAVAETELAVETLVTVRDRVISAYQDIMSMPI